jgi:hypothetical protein
MSDVRPGFGVSPLPLLAVFIVGVFVGGTSVAVSGVTSHPQRPARVAAAAPTSPVPRAAAARNAPTSSVATIRPRPVRPTATPAPTHHRPAPAKHTATRRQHRWLPSGTGMWTYLWSKTMHGNAPAVVHRAKAAGLTTLYVRTGTLADGFVGGPMLRRLLPATRGTGVHVVAWDFPMLRHPRLEAHRLARAAWFHAPGKLTPRVSAVAPDIETPSEGTHATRYRVWLYLHTLRRLLPHRDAILATVPWPSSLRRGHYPYRVVAHHSDALIPMTYWYNRSPRDVTAFSIRWLRDRFHKPVLPLGQGYDSKVDAPYLPHSHQRREVGSFLRTARRHHVRAVSLWSWQTAGFAQWHALFSYRHAFTVPVHHTHHRHRTDHQR